MGIPNNSRGMEDDEKETQTHAEKECFPCEVGPTWPCEESL